MKKPELHDVAEANWIHVYPVPGAWIVETCQSGATSSSSYESEAAADEFAEELRCRLGVVRVLHPCDDPLDVEVGTEGNVPFASENFAVFKGIC